MINCCIFDMGGVMIRDYQMLPELLPFLGLSEQSFSAVDKRLSEALSRHNRGEISEPEFWAFFTQITGRPVPQGESLFGKFFHPKMDEPTLQVVKELKAAGMRVVAGTNVIDAHYDIHQRLNQYDVFDCVYASHLMGISKPSSDFFAYILKSEGIEAAQAFFADDMMENVNAACSAGLNAFLYTDAVALREQLVLIGCLRA